MGVSPAELWTVRLRQQERTRRRNSCNSVVAGQSPWLDVEPSALATSVAVMAPALTEAGPQKPENLIPALPAGGFLTAEQAKQVCLSASVHLPKSSNVNNKPKICQDHEVLAQFVVSANVQPTKIDDQCLHGIPKDLINDVINLKFSSGLDSLSDLIINKKDSLAVAAEETEVGDENRDAIMSNQPMDDQANNMCFFKSIPYPTGTPEEEQESRNISTDSMTAAASSTLNVQEKQNDVDEDGLEQIMGFAQTVDLGHNVDDILQLYRIKKNPVDKSRGICMIRALCGARDTAEDCITTMRGRHVHRCINQRRIYDHVSHRRPSTHTRSIPWDCDAAADTTTATTTTTVVRAIDYSLHLPSKNKPLSKRAAWRFAQERAALASRWTWLQAQISELEYKIRSTFEIQMRIRQAKGPVVLEAASPPPPQARVSPMTSYDDVASTITSTTTSMVNGFSNLLPNNSPATPGLNSIGASSSGAARTRPLVRSQFRKRKLVRIEGLHEILPKVARPSTIKCHCDGTKSSCIICTGRCEPMAGHAHDTMSVQERIATLDACHHPVLTLRDEIKKKVLNSTRTRNNKSGTTRKRPSAKQQQSQQHQLQSQLHQQPGSALPTPLHTDEDEVGSVLSYSSKYSSPVASPYNAAISTHAPDKTTYKERSSSNSHNSMALRLRTKINLNLKKNKKIEKNEIERARFFSDVAMSPRPPSENEASSPAPQPNNHPIEIIAPLVPPYEPRRFPLSDADYQQLLAETTTVRSIPNEIPEIAPASPKDDKIELCRLMFSLKLPKDAIAQFRSHTERFRTRTGPRELMFEHYAWLSSQYSTFAELFDEAIRQGLPAVQTQHPGYYFQLAATHATQRHSAYKELCDASSVIMESESSTGENILKNSVLNNGETATDVYCIVPKTASEQPTSTGIFTIKWKSEATGVTTRLTMSRLIMNSTSCGYKYKCKDTTSKRIKSASTVTATRSGRVSR
ncbi:unnamed protein product [Trichogramma brassicae]|uniref:Trafficking protein particle complex subunit 11 domain-containing protein n=1 Tax=Trichogramma brassicae TaxID=86971 RepID=A0A6H5J1B2_9HYME|nr:unnamed protein product [Trichogramma brassicae]